MLVFGGVFAQIAIAMMPVETEGWWGLPTKDLTILVVTATGRRMYPTHILWKNDIPIEGRIPPGQKSCFKQTIPRIENLWLSSLFPFQFHSHILFDPTRKYMCASKKLWPAFIVSVFQKHLRSYFHDDATGKQYVLWKVDGNAHKVPSCIKMSD